MELYDNSLIFLISDHGHCFGEHGAYGKIPMDMYPELVDIPLMIKPPGDFEGPKRIKQSYVYVHDILPTIYGFLGKEEPDVFDGIDLSVFVDNGDTLIENRNYITCGFSNYTLYKDDEYALITCNDKSFQKLFDLSSDPMWNENISKVNSEICEELFKKIEIDAKHDLFTILEKSSFDMHSGWYVKKK